VGGVIVNMTRPPLLTDAQLLMADHESLPAAGIRQALEQAGLAAHEAEILPALLAEARDHAQRVALERREMGRIEQLDMPTFVLPLLPGGIDLGGLYELADILTAGGVR
jgi:hypothetical protein